MAQASDHEDVVLIKLPLGLVYVDQSLIYEKVIISNCMRHTVYKPVLTPLSTPNKEINVKMGSTARTRALDENIRLKTEQGHLTVI